MARESFRRKSQLFSNVFYQWEFHAVSMCLSGALMVSGKQSVSRSTALRVPSGLCAIGRVVEAVRFAKVSQSVSRCPTWDFSGWIGVPSFAETSIPSISGSNYDD